jgi:hypothetical protein
MGNPVTGFRLQNLLLVVPHFGMMLRQISFLPPVEYEKSTLPSAKIYLPCLMPKAGTTKLAEMEHTPFDNCR